MTQEMKLTLPVLTVALIQSWGPCVEHPPSRYVPEDWSGTALTVLEMPHLGASEKLWVVLHENVLDERTFRLFAAKCARKALSGLTNPDPRSLQACDVAERFANGQATSEELKAARSAAESAAASAAAWSAAESAAWSAAESAAESAARSAAWSAAESAARSEQVNDLIQLIRDNYYE